MHLPQTTHDSGLSYSRSYLVSTNREPQVGDAEGVREAAQALVAQMDRVDEACLGVFAFYQAHGQRYNGPTYESELKALRTALATPIPSEVTPQRVCKCGQAWEDHDCPGDGVEFSREVTTEEDVIPESWVPAVDEIVKAVRRGGQPGEREAAVFAILARLHAAEVTTGEPEISESLKRGIEQAVRGEGSEIDVASLPIDTDNTAISTWSATGSTEFRTSPPGGDGEGGTVVLDGGFKVPWAKKMEEPRAQAARMIVTGINQISPESPVHMSTAIYAIVDRIIAALAEQPPLASRSTVDEEPVAWMVESDGEMMELLRGGWKKTAEDRAKVYKNGRATPLYRKPQQ